MICIPIRPLTTLEAIQQIDKASISGDIVEVWLDRIEDLELDHIIGMHKRKPLLVVNKPVRERGNFQGSEEKRVEILITAAKMGAEFIDIGIDTNEELIRSLISLKHEAQIIVSYHNYIETPSLAELTKIARKIYDLGADIAKIAVAAIDYEDNLQVFKLIELLHQEEKNVIALCMGDKGKISRVYGPMIGSLFAYAPINPLIQTAPGQLSLEELKILWNKVGYKTIY